MTKVPIGRISYINVAPVYHGMDENPPPWLRMVTRPPAELNRMLEDGALVASPVSSAAYARNASKWLLLPDLSIASNGPVLSVLFASRVPMEELGGKEVVVTRESETSVDLLKILLAEKGVSPFYVPQKIVSPQSVPQSSKACLVIGDAALLHDWSRHFPYVWDLGALWKEETGLPFVFAIWAVRKEFVCDAPAMVERLVELFWVSRQKGLKSMDRIVDAAASKTGLKRKILMQYFRLLEVSLGKKQQKGLQLFFDRQHELGLIPNGVTPSFVCLSLRG